MRRLTRLEAVEALESIDMTKDDPETWHAKADEVLLQTVHGDVREAYEHLVRSSGWWAYA